MRTPLKLGWGMTESFALVCFLLSTMAYLYFGFLGINFGVHWDEGKLFSSVNQTASTGIILPRWYHYPSLTYFLTLLSSAVYIGNEFILELDNLKTIDDLKQFLELQRHSYDAIRNFVRYVFFSTGLLTSFFIFLSCWITGIRRSLSLVVSALFISSFQFFYHARWIAPDTLLVVTGSATLLAFIWARLNLSTFRLVILTLCTGLMVSAKYPGGLFVLLP